MKRILIVLVGLNLVACASYFKRKECEAVNWFEHGKSVALRGEWLNSDTLVGECRKAEAEMSESQLDLGFKSGMQKYCSADNAYMTGKSGDLFSRQLCEGPEINLLLAQHKKGISDYCAKSNGQTAGASGKKYQNVCPPELETGFLPEYRKGRKRYVEAMITSREGEIRDLEGKLATKRSDLSFSKGQLIGLERQVSSLQTQKNFIPADNLSQQSFLDSRISSLNSEISTLRSRVNMAENEVGSLERNRTKKSDEIAGFKAELPSLEAQ